MTIAQIEAAAIDAGLFVMGQMSPQDTGETWIFLGTGPTFWPTFTNAVEYSDGKSNPMDRWSKRIIGAIAHSLDAATVYPSDGPPYPPFISHALATGAFFQSPTGMMIHHQAGLMISIRGAVVLPKRLTAAPPLIANPCDTCIDKPCTTACPIGALSGTSPYDVPACKGFLSTLEGQTCMAEGCAARLACPVSQAFTRDPAQSAFHMRAFKGA